MPGGAGGGPPGTGPAEGVGAPGEPCTVTVAPGVALAGRRWGVPEAVQRGRLVVVHGWSEHGGRYAETAGALNRAGWSVLACDQRGHGRSPGRRGVMPGVDVLAADLAALVDEAGSVLPGPGPLCLLGHSLGGLVTLRALQTRDLPVRGAVLSAPWLGEAVGATWWQRAFARLAARVAPDLVVPAPLDPTRLSRDAEMRARRAADPLVHDRGSPGLVTRVAAARAAAVAAPAPGEVPILLLVPGDDRLLDQGPTLAWARAQPPGRVELRLLEGRRHEPLHDLGRDEVVGLIAGWLAQREDGD